MTLHQSARPQQSAALLGIGLSTLWRFAKERPDFPRPRKLSPRVTVFIVAELLAWRDAQVKETDLFPSHNRKLQKKPQDARKD